jgi:hypothetical protein
MCRHVRKSKHNSFRGGALLQGITAGHVAVCWGSLHCSMQYISEYTYDAQTHQR